MLYVKSTKEAVAALETCHVLAYPTETFYGLGCLALRSEALDTLERVKPRNATTKPYPLILGDASQLTMVAQELPSEHLVFSMIKHFWPGPLTLILPALPGLDSRIVGEQGGVAVRVSSHPLASMLALEAGQPIISTSANPTGLQPPKTAAQVEDYFDTEDLRILDGGTCLGGMPSTILDCTTSHFRILREGVIASEQLAPWIDASFERPSEGG